MTQLIGRPVGAPGRAGRPDGLVVLCSANNWDAIKLADRQMAEQLVAHAPVLYVDPPVSHLTRLRNPAAAAWLEGPRLKRVGPRLLRYTPVVAPKPRHPAMRGATSWLVRRQLRHAVETPGRASRVLVAG
jgi:teichuronic acid biosynthesis glycosyltransferase TuaH